MVFDYRASRIRLLVAYASVNHKPITLKQTAGMGHGDRWLWLLCYYQWWIATFICGILVASEACTCIHPNSTIQNIP